ncbi:DUF6259 domain-containing protein [Parapedobacter sp. 10938]|uniref:DUF6259 domain-containing protein n=1 Tax=Parapedobacter flavus TaxID=3110225 RepID=UPI002DBF0ABA|nr:DUF6259 domain-containing protein [Parapedobacter sp. 10938]MEC3880060.1 DUF6259 domain-containing protein [Parapedobacter sp. 10938]
MMFYVYSGCRSKVLFSAFLLMATFVGIRGGYAQIDGNVERLSNGKFTLAFERTTGELQELTSVKDSASFLVDNIVSSGSPWEIIIDGVEKSSRIDAGAASNFSTSRTAAGLELTWAGFEGLPKDFRVTASIDLIPDSAMSVWRIRVDGTEGTLIRKVTFPRIAGLADLDEEELAVPDWMGSLLKSPREAMTPGGSGFGWEYPGHMSMQFISLYNPHGAGIYLASDDTLAHSKTFTLSKDTTGMLVYGVDNYPSYEKHLSSYEPPYAFLIGGFQGDWFTAAQLYKRWAEKQHWSRDSRLVNGKVPDWVQNTSYWVWNRGRAANVLPPAVALSERLDSRVSVLWHWWHGKSYDDSFPEYFPPRDGDEVFKAAVSKAQQQGINALVYMNALKWGPSTQSWVDEGAERFAAKDIDGNMLSHVYNIFTKKALTNMCEATDFWKQKYASLVDTAVNQYGLGGVYMDQICLNRRCYDPIHGHAIGGGNYWMQHVAQKDHLIRANFPKGGTQALAGEGVGENWLPHLDAFLALQVSKERYAGVHHWQTIPLFQAVYHEYGITFGNYSSLLTPPYDEKWPQDQAPDDTETPLDPEFNSQFLMEQARSFVWGMQPMIANYQPFLDTIRKDEIDFLERLAHVRQAGLDYFVFGEFLRSPSLDIPTENIAISRLSIYAGRSGNVTRFENEFPLVYASAWRSKEGNVAVALASISRADYEVDFEIDAEEYSIGSSGTIYLHDESGKRKLGAYGGKRSEIKFSLPPRGICFVEFVPASPTG